MRLLFTNLKPPLRRQVERAGLAGRVAITPTLDEALVGVEEAVLAEAADVPEPATAAGFALLLARAAAAGLPLSEPEAVRAGTEVLRQGEPSDSLILLDRGRLSASVGGTDGGDRVRVATILPGAVVGEIGLYAESPRTATITADVDSHIRRVTRAGLECLAERDPALARDFHALVAALLARRLARTTAYLREVTR